MKKEIILNDGKKIEMRKPKVRDIRAVAHIEIEEERELELFANLTGLTKDEIEDMYLDDYSKLQDTYMGLARGK